MPFARFGTYGYIHHRALNDRAALAAATRAAIAFPEVTHIFEGDVCWHVGEGRSDLYFRHPRRIFDSLSARAIDTAGPGLIRVEEKSHEYDRQFSRCCYCHAGGKGGRKFRR